MPRKSCICSRFKTVASFNSIKAAQAYDTLEIVAQILLAGAKTRPQLRDRLLQVRDFPGVSGTTTIDPHGNAEKTEWVFAQGDEIQIGRDPSNDVPVFDQRVSRIHATISFKINVTKNMRSASDK